MQHQACNRAVAHLNWGLVCCHILRSMFLWGAWGEASFSELGSEMASEDVQRQFV